MSKSVSDVCSNILQGHNRLELIAKVTQDSDAKDNF